MKLLEDFEIQRDETRLEDEILRRITGQREFRSEDELRPAGDQFAISGNDAVLVAAEIADGGIELGKTDFHKLARERRHEPNGAGIRLSSRGDCRASRRWKFRKRLPE